MNRRPKSPNLWGGPKLDWGSSPDEGGGVCKSKILRKRRKAPLSLAWSSPQRHYCGGLCGIFFIIFMIFLGGGDISYSVPPTSTNEGDRSPLSPPKSAPLVALCLRLASFSSEMCSIGWWQNLRFEVPKFDLVLSFLRWTLCFESHFRNDDH